MPLSEFDIIEKYFSGIGTKRQGVVCDQGDDCAVVDPEGQQLALTVDSLVAEVHFDRQTPPDAVGYKAVAVSLSDLAAMGAEPAWMTLAISLPEIDHAWLEAFSQGVKTCCEKYAVALVGGNISHGPLNISTQLIGRVAAGHYLQRSTAGVNDDIYVTGSIGDAGIGLLLHTKQTSEAEWIPAEIDYFTHRLYRPTPRLEIGRLIRPLASACIDISDGLAADLGHILRQSHLGAEILLEDLPIAGIASERLLNKLGLDELAYRKRALVAGEDYELCFTCSPAARAQIEEVARVTAVPISRIGSITQAPGLSCRFKSESCSIGEAGYRHF